MSLTPQPNIENLTIVMAEENGTGPETKTKTGDDTKAGDENKTVDETQTGGKEDEPTGPTRSIHFLKVGGGRDARPLFMLKVPEATINTKTLSALQSIMRANDKTKEYCKLPFSNVDGAIVDSTWLIDEYLKEVEESDMPKDPPNTKADSADSSTPKKTSNLKAYLKRSSEWKKIEDGDIPKMEIELPKLPGYIEAPKISIPRSGINKADWRANRSTTNPQELKEKDWKLVVINNALCYGLSVIRQATGNGKSSPVGLIRAPYPAFRITPRRLFDEDDKDEPEVRIPEFIVDDHSYVSIYETKTQFQSSLSKASIDTVDISASLGLPAFGGVLGFGGGVKSSSSTQEQTDESGESSLMNISYNFPRVSVRLDEYSLEMTNRCLETLKKASKDGKADQFLEEFGEYFSTQVQLGGRLLASEEFDGKSTSSAKDTKSSLKIQAALSFKPVSGGGEGSAGGGYGKGGENASSSGNARSESTLQWQANGGDTLLCNDAPSWCPSVAPYQNWRTINRAGNRHILNLLARFDKTVKDTNDGKESTTTVKELVKSLLSDKIKDPAAPVHEQPVLHQRQGRMFYLRRSDNGGWSYNKYLTAFEQHSVEWSVDQIAALQKTTGTLPSMCGTIVMRKELEESHQAGCYLELLTPKIISSTTEGQVTNPGGNGVTKIMYGQPYALRNPSTELFLALDPSKTSETTSYPVIKTEMPTDGFWFLRGRDGTDKGPVNQADEVTLRWCQLKDDGTLEDQSAKILSIFHETDWTGLLRAVGKTSESQELKLTMMYKDVWEGKAVA